MRLTTALYYTPSGRSIQKVGIMPDILVKQILLQPLEARDRGREVDLRGALNNGGKNGKPQQNRPKGTPHSQPTDKSDSSKQDFQLQRALDLLKGIAIFQPNKG